MNSFEELQLVNKQLDELFLTLKSFESFADNMDAQITFRKMKELEELKSEILVNLYNNKTTL
jgi:hypothetical protein